MLLSRFFLSICVLALTGCGFQPLHQDRSGPTKPIPFSLKITGTNEDAYTTYRFKQELQPLLSGLTLPKGQKIEIKIQLGESYGDIGYGADASVMRSQGRITATVEMFSSSKDPFYVNTLDVVSSYTINESEEFSNMNAKGAARERLIVVLAQDVAREISLVIRKLNDAPDFSKGMFFKPEKIDDSKVFSKKNVDRNRESS